MSISPASSSHDDANRRSHGAERAAKIVLAALALAPAACHEALPQSSTCVRDHPRARTCCARPELASNADEAGALYLLVSYIGLLRVDDGDARVLIDAGDHDLWSSANLVFAPDREIWLDDESGIRVVDRKGEVRWVRSAPGTFFALAVRSANDAWGLTPTADWRVEHFDGHDWQILGDRRDFAGRLADQPRGLAVTHDSVWVASDEGLWRHAEGRWERISEPEAGVARLDAYRGQLVTSAPGSLSLWMGDAWQTVSGLPTGGASPTLSGTGLIVVPDERTLLLSSILAPGCTAISEQFDGVGFEDLAIDLSARVWLAAQSGLTLFEPDGRVVGQWAPGRISGVKPRIEQVEVVGSGPSRLPPTVEVQTRSLIGRVLRDGYPLQGAKLLVCLRPLGDGPCVSTSRVAVGITERDGSFEFAEVPAVGELRVTAYQPEEGRKPASLWIGMRDDCPTDRTKPCDIGAIEVPGYLHW